MLRVHIRALRAKDRSEIHFDERISIAHILQGRSDVLSGDDAHCVLRAIDASQLVQVSGTVETRLDLRCARCLTPYSHVLSTPIQELFYEPSENVHMEEAENVHAVHDDWIDLVPHIEENISLAIPFVPLCSEDCRGLCVTCGVNRNHDSCQCAQTTIDPRLAGLASWFNSDANGK